MNHHWICHFYINWWVRGKKWRLLFGLHLFICQRNKEIGLPSERFRATIWLGNCGMGLWNASNNKLYMYTDSAMWIWGIHNIRDVVVERRSSGDLLENSAPSIKINIYTNQLVLSYCVRNMRAKFRRVKFPRITKSESLRPSSTDRLNLVFRALVLYSISS